MHLCDILLKDLLGSLMHQVPVKILIRLHSLTSQLIIHKDPKASFVRMWLL